MLEITTEISLKMKEKRKDSGRDHHGNLSEVQKEKRKKTRISYKEQLKFGKINTGKRKFHSSKEPIDINNIDIERTGFKHFGSYKRYDK